MANDKNFVVKNGLNAAGQITTTIVTGTAPLSVSSNTLVTNLNSDLLDGLHSSAFLQGIAANSVGATELNVTGNGTIVQYLRSDADGTFTWDTPTGGISWSAKTANYTAVSNDGIIANTSGGTFTVTLPATPATGDVVSVVDGGNWATTNLTIGRNGSTIEGDAADMTLDIGGVSVDFIYDGATWQTYIQLGASGGAFFDSPAFTGTPTAPTAAAATNTTQIATTAHVFAAVAKSANADFTVDPTLLADRAAIKTLVDSSGAVVVHAAVNFNGTGVIAINSSYNVASITDNGTGRILITFTTAAPNTNYLVMGTARTDGTITNSRPSAFVSMFSNATKSVSAVEIVTGQSNTAEEVDCPEVSVIIYRIT
jgi:hypothetical protein